MIVTNAPRLGSGKKVFDFRMRENFVGNTSVSLGLMEAYDAAGVATRASGSGYVTTNSKSRYGGIGQPGDVVACYNFFNNVNGTFDFLFDDFHIAALTTVPWSGSRAFLCGQSASNGANGTLNIGINSSNQWTASVNLTTGSLSFTGPTRDTTKIQRVDLVRSGSRFNLFVDGFGVGWQTSALAVFQNATNKFSVGSPGENTSQYLGGAYGTIWGGFVERFVIVKDSALFTGNSFDPFDPRPFY